MAPRKAIMIRIPIHMADSLKAHGITRGLSLNAVINVAIYEYAERVRRETTPQRGFIANMHLPFGPATSP